MGYGEELQEINLVTPRFYLDRFSMLAQKHKVKLDFVLETGFSYTIWSESKFEKYLKERIKFAKEQGLKVEEK